MRRILLTILLGAVVVATGASGPARPASPSAADDVHLLMQRIRAAHPDPFHATPEPAFQAAADQLAARADGLSPDQLLVELMRFNCLLGERDGHSGIFPLDSAHRRGLHLFPPYPYKFAAGPFVVSAPRRGAPVGSEGVAPPGIPAPGPQHPGGP